MGGALLRTTKTDLNSAAGVVSRTKKTRPKSTT